MKIFFEDNLLIKDLLKKKVIVMSIFLLIFAINSNKLIK